MAGTAPGARPQPSWPGTASRTSPISSSALAGSCTSTQYDPTGKTIDWRKPCGRSVAVSTTSWRWPGRPGSCRSTSPRSRRRHGPDGPSVSRPEECGVPTPPTVTDTLTTTATRPHRPPRRQVHGHVRPRPVVRDRGARPPDDRPAPPRPGPRPQHRRLRQRLRRVAARRPRPRAVPGVSLPRRCRRRLHARRQRGAGRHRGRRHPTTRRARRPAPRRRCRLLVRQEPRPRPGGRRHPARQLLRHDSVRRRGRGDRRRPVLQVVDAAELVGVDGPQPRRPAARPRLGGRRPHPRPARRRPLPARRRLDRPQDRRRHRRRRGHGRPRRPGRLGSPHRTSTGQCSARCCSAPPPPWPRSTCSTSGSPASSTTPAGPGSTG